MPRFIRAQFQHILDAGSSKSEKEFVQEATWPGTDHTRERVPVLVAGAGAGGLGHLRFVDVAARVAAHLGVPAQGMGRGEL